MGPGLNRNDLQNPSPRSLSLEAARVSDSFDLKDAYGLNHEPGVVLVLERLEEKDAKALAGRRVRISTPAGRTWLGQIHDAKAHGKIKSLFLREVSRSDIPVGSIVTLVESENADAGPTKPGEKRAVQPL